MKKRKSPNFAYTYLKWEIKTDRNRVRGAMWRGMKSTKTKNYNHNLKKLTSNISFRPHKKLEKRQALLILIKRDKLKQIERDLPTQYGNRWKL